MASKHENLDPLRLVEAAEASLTAAAQCADNAGTWPYPADLMGAPGQPDCLGSFTKWEIQEACAFLVRLGILERPHRRAA